MVYVVLGFFVRCVCWNFSEKTKKDVLTVDFWKKLSWL